MTTTPRRGIQILTDGARRAAPLVGAAIGFGMQTLDQCMVELVKRNVIAVDEARMRAVNKDAFR